MSAAYETLDPACFRTALHGRDVALFTLRAGAMEASVTNYGARIVQILAPDRAGQVGDVLLGYPSIEAYLHGQKSMGAFIGRYANRIAHGRFTLDGVAHQLPLNAGAHTLHGGPGGSRFQVWDARQLSASSVEMTWLFPDGADGFPGAMPLRVLYSVTEAGAFTIEYAAVAVGRATVASLTSHGYFNLSGTGAPVGGHVLHVAADEALELDADGVPTGRTLPVAGTALDFRAPAPIGPGLDGGSALVQARGGYDHPYVLRGPDALRLAASVHEPASGRAMEVWTTEPCLQLFTANTPDGIAGPEAGKNGAVHARHGSLCLEAQQFPDAPNHPQFPSAALRPGQWRTGRTVHRFSVR